MVLCALQSIHGLNCFVFLIYPEFSLTETWPNLAGKSFSYRIPFTRLFEGQTTQKILVWVIIMTHVTRRNRSEMTTIKRESAGTKSSHHIGDCWLLQQDHPTPRFRHSNLIPNPAIRRVTMGSIKVTYLLP